jgi:hypothetical protein
MNSQRKPMRLAAKLVLAVTIGSLAATPAFARGHRDRGHDHGHGGGIAVGVYSDPVYVPQPVYYDPAPSPGISISVPLNLHIR